MWHAEQSGLFANDSFATSSRLYLLRSSAALSLRKRLFYGCGHGTWGEREAREVENKMGVKRNIEKEWMANSDGGGTKTHPL